ncbi:PLD nuclease N-terminal domain-containing protein [Sanguibacter antarcticus]|uniref:Phospholipase D-like protein n=1 Tax=Sanguibacter antarcticus TaxID=372484 RepID=A0A2A9E738_9MICO|nr:PLD nuclease N-terminal domain-containing protein [Sanguibacter antarcticus]PFG34135.1 phospholipase D-like protein [Sanguibacter antarcticus]
MSRVLAVLAAFGLLVYAFSDFASSDAEDRGDIPRWLWLVIIVILPYFGPLAWIAFSRSRRAQAAREQSGQARGRGAASQRRTRRRATGPVAPDDDPDFLWRLAQEQHRQARDEQSKNATGASGTAGGTQSAGPTGATGDGLADGPTDDLHDDLRKDDTRDDETPA